MLNWRKATWALAIWTLLGVLWTASYVGGIGDCRGETGNELVVCEIGRAIGLEAGLPLIVSVWAIGLLVLGLIWLRSRRVSA